MILTKFIAQCGVASRRRAAELVKAGAITVDGRTETNPAARVTEDNTICYDGKALALPAEKFYIMLHKPRGYTCTHSDPNAKKKAVDLVNLPGTPKLISVGRLDKDSEGLLLFTNDGDFVAELTHPRHQVEKSYIVSTDRELPPETIASMLSGIEDDGESLQAKKIIRLKPTSYKFILTEGKNREVRRLVAHAGAETKRLRRVRVGKLDIGELPVGKWRFLSEAEVRMARGK